MDDFPYRAEYSRSNRASCKGCKCKIDKDILRLAVMVKSPMFDGKTPHWYHSNCFFTKQRPKSVADFAHFEQLRWEDQEAIRKKLGSAGPDASGSGKKNHLKDYRTEYAKSGKSTCRSCNAAIPKGDVRISKKDYDSDRSKLYGPMDSWYHVDCFSQNRDELSYFESADKLSGFKTLSKDDQIMLKNKLPKMKRKAVDSLDGEPPVKIKIEDTSAERKAQNKLMFNIRDKLSQLSKSELEQLLTHNELEVPSGSSRILDRLSDCMAFGIPLPCEKCHSNSIVFRSGIGYQCLGNLTEWTKCNHVLKTPPKKAFDVPESLKMEYSFLNKYKCKIENRIFDEATHLERDKNQKEIMNKMFGKLPLQGMVFSLDVNLSRKNSDIINTIATYGGKVSTNPKDDTAALISTKDNVTNQTPKVLLAERHHVHVIPVEFLDEIQQGGASLLISKMNLANWGSDVESRIQKSSSKSVSSGKKLSSKSSSGSARMVMKNGAVVDPDSDLVDEAHVLKHGGKFYTAVLNLVDLTKDVNSYYKLQLLESDSKKRDYWVFRSWGRIGTSIGGTKLESFATMDDAMESFVYHYEDKTGNSWKSAKCTKIPGKYYPIELEFADDSPVANGIKAGSKSKLKKPIVDLIQLIFDVEAMQKSLVEFELDLKKLPLGKISQRQIQEGYKVLGEASNLLTSEADNKLNLLLDCSNRFYTLIPHDFGVHTPPLLDNTTIIQHKTEMLENLMEISLAYNILKTEAEEGDKSEDPVDKHYKRLKTEIDVLSKEDEEYSLLEKYLKNTHAETHRNYELDLLEVYSVKRRGEAKRYKPFKKLHNRMLLWHGSRVTNYAGILSQGLRIAPPEAPSTGYMFGKGIYFADMMSKSANYCCTSPSNPIGLLLLCEVALGNMYELKGAEYIQSLPDGMHSTKGIGKTTPDPSMAIEKEGVQIPLGLPVKEDSVKSSLLYNEYIVYDPSQVNIKYILKTKFNYKY